MEQAAKVWNMEQYKVRRTRNYREASNREKHEIWSSIKQGLVSSLEQQRIKHGAVKPGAVRYGLAKYEQCTRKSEA